MKTVKTITCHDVYNAGASLQAYALQTYLETQGYDAEIINYKPEYLTRHYRLNVVSNPKYDKPIVRQLYLAAKLRRRMKARKSRKKAEFDVFREKYLKLTKQTFCTNNDLKKGNIQADAFIAGSDQIWNPVFETGKDPSFFLDFVTSGKKISYAASFAVKEIPSEFQDVVRERLNTFDSISVREKSGVKILNDMGLEGKLVCDPVFLLPEETWTAMCNGSSYSEKYAFVYDFDNSGLIRDLVQAVSEEKQLKIVSYFHREYADYCCESGPLTFLQNIQNADLIISNSFHATAFALIFHKEFYAVGRREPINSRMYDLLDDVGLQDRYLESAADWKNATAIDWDKVERLLKDKIDFSKEFLKNSLET